MPDELVLCITGNGLKTVEAVIPALPEAPVIAAKEARQPGQRLQRLPPFSPFRHPRAAKRRREMIPNASQQERPSHLHLLRLLSRRLPVPLSPRPRAAQHIPIGLA